MATSQLFFGVLRYSQCLGEWMWMEVFFHRQIHDRCCPYVFQLCIIDVSRMKKDISLPWCSCGVEEIFRFSHGQALALMSFLAKLHRALDIYQRIIRIIVRIWEDVMISSMWWLTMKQRASVSVSQVSCNYDLLLKRAYIYLIASGEISHGSRKSIPSQSCW